MKARISKPKSDKKVIMYNIDESEHDKVKKVAAQIGLKAVIADKTFSGRRLGELAELSGFSASEHFDTDENAPNESAAVFCGFDSGEVWKVLPAFSEIKINYKAILTQMNKDWTLAQLVRELGREHKQLKEGGAENKNER